MSRLVWIGKIAVNLVRQHHQAMTARDVQHLNQFRLAPDPSHRIMGRTQQQYLGLRPGGALLQMLQIHAVVTGFVCHQRIFNHGPAGIPDRAEKRRVHRRLDNHALSGLGKGQAGRVEGRHHPGRHDNPVSLDAPAMTAFKPLDHGLIKAVREQGIAIYRMLRPLGQSTGDRFRGREVHIGDPRRYHIVTAEYCLAGVELDRTGVLSGDGLIENAAIHGGSACCLRENAIVVARCRRRNRRFGSGFGRRAMNFACPIHPMLANLTD